MTAALLGLADRLRAFLPAFLVWTPATVGFYVLARVLYRRFPRWWLSPLFLAPVLLLALALGLGAGYAEYMRGAGWLMTLLGPATVAFALPIWEQRAVIRRLWPVLLAGVLAGSLTSVAVSCLLARLVHLPPGLELSLLPRSISTPFALIASGELGGAPNLTAVFVIVTGVGGATFGAALLARLPLASPEAKGAGLGMAAHAAGVAAALRLGRGEGSVAGLVMVLAGIANVLAAPLLAPLLARLPG
ncbi:MAG: LrgB family protein [Desulfovibrionaceae bacterium]